MAADRAKLRASKDQAVAAKRAFQEAFAADLADCAVALAPSNDGEHWTLKVYVQRSEGEVHLPEQFDDLEVDVDVIGPVAAH